MEISHVCSLGQVCQSSRILKDNYWKKCSYPFDWVLSNPKIILHCLEDDFKIFLDKSYYISYNRFTSGHSYYNKNLWCHHNPLMFEKDYNYYIRCVDRFKRLLQNEDHKLFVMSFVNMDEIPENLKNDIINFNDKFSTYTKNYKLLIILHLQNKEKQQSLFTHHDNIDFLELHTLSKSDGVIFQDKSDNIYLSDLMKTTYNFQVKEYLT